MGTLELGMLKQPIEYTQIIGVLLLNHTAPADYSSLAIMHVYSSVGLQYNIYRVARDSDAPLSEYDNIYKRITSEF